MKPKSFYEICREAKPKLDILKYYPFGNETEWSYWLSGEVDLKKAYLELHVKNKTEMQLIIEILKNVGRAMHYTIVSWGPDQQDGDAFSSQRIEAFNMWNLFTCGYVDWNKKIIKNKSIKDVEELEKLHEDRYDKIHPEIKAHRLKNFKTEKSKNEYLKLLEKNKPYYRKKYGILEIKHLPLMTYHSNKPLYTHRELSAIWIMVECAFENMC